MATKKKAQTLADIATGIEAAIPLTDTSAEAAAALTAAYEQEFGTVAEPAESE